VIRVTTPPSASGTESASETSATCSRNAPRSPPPRAGTPAPSTVLPSSAPPGSPTTSPAPPALPTSSAAPSSAAPAPPGPAPALLDPPRDRPQLTQVVPPAPVLHVLGRLELGKVPGPVQHRLHHRGGAVTRTRGHRAQLRHQRQERPDRGHRPRADPRRLV